MEQDLGNELSPSALRAWKGHLVMQLALNFYEIGNSYDREKENKVDAKMGGKRLGVQEAGIKAL